MSFVNQSFQEHSFTYIDAGLFNKYYGHSVPYATIPVVHPVEVEPFPAIFYTLYPPLPVNLLESDSVVGEKKLLQVNNISTSEAKDNKSNVYVNTSRDCGSKFGTSSVHSCHKLDESISLSDCSPQDSMTESEEGQFIHSLSSTVSDSFETEKENPKRNATFGFFGLDGCWYPFISDSSSSSSSSSSISVESNVSLCNEKSFDSQFHDTGKSMNVEIIPPSRLMMPKSLMPYYNCYQRLDLPSTALGRPQLIPTFSTDGNFSLEELWTAHMTLLFRNFPHKWNIYAAHSSKPMNQSWYSFRDLAKVRFYCQRCMDGWTSMFGVVVFFYSWNHSLSCGEICYEVSGQKCGKCSPDSFELPLWYPEEAQKVITNLYYEIASRIYGLRTPQPIRTRRLGQPVNHHNKSLCQGCTQGLCKQDLKEPNGIATSEEVSPPVAASSFDCTGQSDGCSIASQSPPTPPSGIPPRVPYAQNLHSTARPPHTYFDSPFQFPVPNIDPSRSNLMPQMAVFYPFSSY